jgi:type IV pilus assembly protein PilY1
MNTVRSLKVAAMLCIGSLLTAPAFADDIDIFLGTSADSSDAPNVMFLIDNSPNWSKASQKWPDAPTQGQAEVQAIAQVLQYLSSNNQNINVGLAMLSSNSGSSGTGGGYIRFGVRNMLVPANNTALQNILTVIYNNINSPSEKLQPLQGGPATYGQVTLHFAPSSTPPSFTAKVVAANGYL